MRLVIASVVIAITMYACATPSSTEVRSGLDITTSSGRVAGYEMANGTQAWFDIPYATPPVGQLRWKAPRPAQATEALIEKSASPIACTQLNSSANKGLSGEGVVGSEDCLYLDIRAPLKTQPTSALPVMVWIHGGGNTTGYKGAYDFSTMAREKNVIVVTLNYRLGPLGWITHPGIQGDASALDQSSNFGTLDIIEALKWVQTNIASFGGNPSMVTVFGESAGGHNVYALLASPLTDGLFHRAIVQSGYVSSISTTNAFNNGNQNPYVARSSTALAMTLNLIDDASQSESITREQWLALPASKLMAAWENIPDTGEEALTTADGIVIPSNGLLASLGDPTLAKHVPVISGANRDEVSLWLANNRYFIDASYPFTRLGPPRLQVRDPGKYQRWVRIRSHAWKLRGVDDALTALARAGYESLYAYRFSWDEQERSWFADFPMLLGAAHGIDISFVTADWYYGPVTNFVYPDVDSRDRLAQTMIDAWATFAAKGHPPSDLQWQPWDPAAKGYIELDGSVAPAMQAETSSLPDLLDSISGAPEFSSLERCTVLWESLVNIGEPDYAAYARWQDGRCKNTDVPNAKLDIRRELESEHGSAEVL